MRRKGVYNLKMSESKKGDQVNKIEVFNEREQAILRALESISDLGGEEYSGSTEKARRNPIKADTGPLMSEYARLKQPRHVLDIGTAYGKSLLYLGLGNPDAVFSGFEFDADVAKAAQRTVTEAGLNATVYPGTFEDMLADAIQTGGKVDLASFDHDKKTYLPDFERLEEHLAPGALILADNVLDRYEECSDFVNYVLAKYGGHIVPTEAGLLVATIETTE